jgi:hypothetical protein
LKVNKHLNKIMLIFHLRSWISYCPQKFPPVFHLKNLLDNRLSTILLWRVFLEGYIFLNGIRGKLQFFKHLREKKWLCIFRAICLNVLHPFFREQLFFFSFPQKLVVGGLFWKNFQKSIMGFIYFNLEIRGKFGNFTIVQILFFYLLSKIFFFF